MKLIPFLLALTILVGAAPAPNRSPWESIYLVRQGEQTCTGFAVGIVQVITAAHCVNVDGDEITLDGKPTRVLKHNDAFVLLSQEPAAKPPLPLGRVPQAGDEVTAYGFGYGFKLQMKRWIAGFQDDKHPVIDGEIVAGMSGGPTINSRGEVVGLNQAYAPGMGLICGPNEIKDFIK